MSSVINSDTEMKIGQARVWYKTRWWVRSRQLGKQHFVDHADVDVHELYVPWWALVFDYIYGFFVPTAILIKD